MSSILLVEDDVDVAFATRRLLTLKAHRVTHTESAQQALAAVGREVFDVALLDLGLPDSNGFDLLKSFGEIDASMPVIVLSGRDDADSAKRALQAGAHDYLVKPTPVELLDLAIERLCERQRIRRQLEGMSRTDRRAGAMLGRSPTFLRALERLHAAAAAPRLPILISGESGTGKELAAREVHARSARSTGPFITANIAATPADLLEAELFGHEAGAFTGARSARRGLFELADGGVLFLDEIGELPIDVQPKLLRVVEKHPFRRLGGEREIHCDVRLVTATHRDLAARVADGSFRADLYHRLHVLAVHLPPLRQREGDVELLAQHFLQRLSAEIGRPPPTLAPNCLDALASHPWPGNIRQLRNALEHALVLGDKEILHVADLPSDLWHTEDFELRRPEPTSGALSPRGVVDPARHRAIPQATLGASPDVETLDEVARRHALQVLAGCDGNLSHAARLLGVARSTLRRRLAGWQAEGDPSAD
ncbi:MAG: sigma-54 dependent transcriptional regulator [Acidobacteriota bacterium]